MKRVWMTLGLLLAATGCGKKADPSPPLPKAPARTTDVAVEQQSSFAVITFTFPALRADGLPLRDLQEIDVYRLENPSPSLTAAPAAAGGSAGPAQDRAPIAGERRRAAAARAREESFLQSAKRIAALTAGDFAEATRGSQVISRDSLESILTSPSPAREIAYAVVSRRRSGERSEISNIATLKPEIPPERPTNLFAWAEENRICVTWTAPEKNVAGHELAAPGYRVYRRRLEDEEFGKPLNPAPVEATDFTDATAAYNNDYVYTVTASEKEHPQSEGLPAIEFGIAYRDVFPPPAVDRIDALPEENLVRLQWAPVEAPDLAGYDLFRCEEGGPWVRLNAKPLTETSFLDRSVAAGRHYRYRVRAVDTAGNAGAPSPESPARPYGANP